MTAADRTQDDDELFVLTAAMLTPERFPGVLGDDYPAACAHLGLPPLPDGYGLMFGQDGGGARWTVATTDAAMVACALAAWDCGLEYEVAPDEGTLAASLPGWPLPVAVSAPGVPAPHDPADEEAGPALAPPDVSVWGPAQRRLGADEIAVHWYEWRDQLDPADAPDAESGADTESAPEAGAPDADAGKAAAEPAAEAAAEPAPEAPADPAETPAEAPTGAEEQAAEHPVSHGGVRRALQDAEEYLRTPPPPGRVRTTGGSLRADGPGWSLVARADDVAFVLLDEAPGQVLPVGRGPSLPPLLEALDKLAAQQS
ncbi:hypothetical protein NMG29_13750 [Streptomyces cocklensis]|jgi:hypothetical protein|uniref:Integral membrane protein n=1 Tax=Actinacidiphila cocklensis TaxID=887465 RepID=A0A9W4GPG1_9ACTN|nr:hypothetical protein [Actinacidiphila cocklensis]MDD1059261.1 hypothetical protein [Actinacidiphila cocklensis]WSX73233.1 hypothetical protein OH826_04850 [Streptomyces sp. NBC_00899]WSX80701.1 hypothetical protein OH826_46660 [Streptomyces sp. NBC_00899]CAG6392460.1 conserved hypothetical protein [Actinacidiphila cocklensis]